MKSLTLKELININKITLEDVINTTGLSRTTISGIYNETYRVSKKIRDIFKEHYEIYLIDKRFVEDNSKDSKSTEILKIANSEIDAKIKELEEIKNKNNFNIKLNYILENSDALYNDSQFKLAIDRLCENRKK